MDFIIQNILNALQWGSFYALIALGYTLVYGVLRLINFAHGDIFMVGAYIAFFVAGLLLGPVFGLSPLMTFVIAVPLTMVLTACVGVTLERVAYRPLRRKGAHRLYVVITALMCGLILEYGNLAVLGASRLKFPELVEKSIWHMGGVTVTNLKVIVIFAAIAVFLFLNFIVTKTKIGMAMRGISYDKFAIPLMGIPIDAIIVFTFVLGSGFAGLAGLLYGMSYPILEPFMGMIIGWKAFIAAVVGGIGDIRGAFYGGFLLGFIEVGVVTVFPSTYRDLFAFTILLIILWMKPTGLFGMPQSTKIQLGETQMKKYSLNVLMAGLAVLLLVLAQFRIIDNYIQAVIMYVGINIIMSTSLNLVNGNMGEFTCGHAAFMCTGAYVASILSVLFFGKAFGDPLLPPSMAFLVFPLMVLAGGVVASLISVLVAVPAFKTRDDYLAIITIAVNYMVISAIENMDFVGGSRGFQGMKSTVWAMRETLSIPWMLFWVITFTVFTIWVIRRFITSTYGKGVNAVCQDEVAAEIMSVNTNKIKLVNFMISAGLAGCAGGLFAHIVGYVNPQSFNILKSTEAMVMVYLGGMGSLSGAVISAVVFTGLLEVLRSQALIDFLLAPATFVFPEWEPSAGVIKWVMIPLLLVLIMQFRPEGIMGNKELSDVFPKLKKYYTFK